MEVRQTISCNIYQNRPRYRKRMQSEERQKRFEEEKVLLGKRVLDFNNEKQVWLEEQRKQEANGAVRDASLQTEERKSDLKKQELFQRIADKNICYLPQNAGRKDLCFFS